MKIKCEYCGAFISDTDDKCENCGGKNYHYKNSDGRPKTIHELRKWYEDQELPPKEVTRFFIGEDFKGPRAFGIYYDGDNYVVYKNNSNAERMIRYEGDDEVYAVNELYLKLKEEILRNR